MGPVSDFIKLKDGRMIAGAGLAPQSALWEVTYGVNESQEGAMKLEFDREIDRVWIFDGRCYIQSLDGSKVVFEIQTWAVIKGGGLETAIEAECMDIKTNNDIIAQLVDYPLTG
jgi:hypothetical protein